MQAPVFFLSCVIRGEFSVRWSYPNLWTGKEGDKTKPEQEKPESPNSWPLSDNLETAKKYGRQCMKTVGLPSKDSVRVCDLPVFYCEPPTLFNGLV